MPTPLAELRTPRPGAVDAARCPVCGSLRAELAAALRAGDAHAARATVHAMHTHMVYGHPNDPRNRPRREAWPSYLNPP
ncbi:hypothetical protein [Streptomyces antibioticus]|uniref:Uncharacterized protein n=1 Tax=Streptomyces antibioticus TaxID=1890 RepID=A0AAE6YED5_STRAT|nr:hypothetical protein [Streptomyces antibioticus]QIT47282.1 hypothetical protein HCX60_30300 [Streptomyces antibioticus]